MFHFTGSFHFQTRVCWGFSRFLDLLPFSNSSSGTINSQHSNKTVCFHFPMMLINQAASPLGALCSNTEHYVCAALVMCLFEAQVTVIALKWVSFIVNFVFLLSLRWSEWIPSWFIWWRPQLRTIRGKERIHLTQTFSWPEGLGLHDQRKTRIIDIMMSYESKSIIQRWHYLINKEILQCSRDARW